MFPTLLTKREVAERARVHVGTLNRLIREGRGPALVHVGQKALIREDAFKRWIKSGSPRPIAAVQAAE